ncbi:ATP-binding cassette domain-containing protein [Enterococcus thailandicus]|uniref:ATP-binding cassette domain-containing protein n=1 Tax=Enterococcus thailandicus TaxID=417368 RepID=UPI00289084CE|nr:ATP-binding cassette domain-containing protein [Enterococcus thailandicus]MDT2751716.1 ATP-binding cassette domain-containing protein [Enterococcus thailandicus]
MEKYKVKLDLITKEYELIKKKSDRIKFLFYGNKLKNKKFWALKGVSLEVKQGETIGLIGINGSGKTTLSNIISGIVPPTSGKLLIDGETSIISIGAGLKTQLTGVENIKLKSLMSGMNLREIDEKMSDIIDFADLGDFIYQPVKNYSSGMRSRLGFAIAVFQDPDILIIDEALAVGDETFYQKCVDKMMEFKKNGKTIFFVSHSLSQVQRLCDKTVWMHYGELKKFGPTKEVISEYKKFISWFKNLDKDAKEAYQKKYKQAQSNFDFEDFSDKVIQKNVNQTTSRRVIKEKKEAIKRNPVGERMRGSTKLLLCFFLLIGLFSAYNTITDFDLSNQLKNIINHNNRDIAESVQTTVSSTKIIESENSEISTEISTETSSYTSTSYDKTYVVKQGDTLAQIAELYQVSLEDLIAANEALNENNLYPGEVINIPEIN